ncbi:ABC transporter permease [Leeia sp.]|uniref:ABC transporter permease n=1 Tax=Leeia sp. TaxID=2884678 RepID=UPI0035B355EC
MSEDALKQVVEKYHDMVPLGHWADQTVNYLKGNFQPFFNSIGAGIEWFANSIEHSLLITPSWVLLLIFAGVGLWRRGALFAGFTLVSLLSIMAMEQWDAMVKTLALVLSSTFLSLLLGVPLGIWCAKSRRINALVRPVLDFMQTMPAFVYLIPAVFFFGVGQVPGLLSTIIFAMPPAVRLTTLGIRLVNKELVEAGHAFGCTGAQLLFKVQLPTALPSIMAGVNQTIMMALSMVIIASMVGASGLGDAVMGGISRMDIGLGFEGGLSVVLLAVILDRITETFGNGRGKQQAMS